MGARLLFLVLGAMLISSPATAGTYIWGTIAAPSRVAGTDLTGVATDFRQIIADLKADIDVRLVDSEQGGRVHKGFKGALDEVWKKLRPELDTVREGNRPLWVTGHSLGAALATLAADRYGDVQGLYTFGSPRVGDPTFKDHFHVKTYRVVNNEDVVTRVPPPNPYVHVGVMKYIDSGGVIHDNPGRWERWTDDIIGHMATIFNLLGQIRHGFSGIIPEGLRQVIFE